MRKREREKEMGGMRVGRGVAVSLILGHNASIGGVMVQGTTLPTEALLCQPRGPDIDSWHMYNA